MQMKTLVEMENSGLVTLLRDDKYDDLARMYSLFRRVDSGSALIRTVMSDHVKEVGKQLVQDPDRCKVRGGGLAAHRVAHPLPFSCISGARELERLITLPTAQGSRGVCHQAARRAGQVRAYPGAVFQG